MTGPVDPPIGHNGGPPLEEPPRPEAGQCKHCRHWHAPSQTEQRAYEHFRLGLSKRRVKRPAGACDRVLTRPDKPVSFSATSAEFGCLNFSAKSPAPRPTGGGFVTIYEAGRIVWQGGEEAMPARFRQEALDLPAPGAEGGGRKE
jgi:hypothetical protein